MLPRHIGPVLLKAAKEYPVVCLTGPRQSGKTTLVREAFSQYQYVSLEVPEQRELALAATFSTSATWRRSAGSSDCVRDVAGNC